MHNCIVRSKFKNILIMKKISLFFIVAIFCISAHSHVDSLFCSHPQINLKVEAATNFPFGTMNNYYHNSPGVDINVKCLLTKRLGVGISSGFEYFYAKYWGNTYWNNYSNINFYIIPIRASINYFLLTKWFKPYLGFEFGLNLTNLKYVSANYDINTANYIFLHRNSFHARFGDAPVAGIQIDIAKTFALDINSKINYISNLSNSVIETTNQISDYYSISAGLVYKFGVKKQELSKK